MTRRRKRKKEKQVQGRERGGEEVVVAEEQEGEQDEQQEENEKEGRKNHKGGGRGQAEKIGRKMNNFTRSHETTHSWRSNFFPFSIFPFLSLFVPFCFLSFVLRPAGVDDLLIVNGVLKDALGRETSAPHIGALRC